MSRENRACRPKKNMGKTKINPGVYDIKDIMDIMGLGRTSAYAWIGSVYEEQKPFRVLKIGGIYKVPKKSFDAWLDAV